MSPVGRGGGGRSGGDGRGVPGRQGSAGAGSGRGGSAGRGAAAGRGGAAGRGSARVGGRAASVGRSDTPRPAAPTGRRVAPRSSGAEARPGRPRRAPGPEAGEQVEGRQAVRELLRARRRAVHSVTIADSTERNGLLDEIVALAADGGVPVRRVGRDRIEAMALTDAPQGVIAAAEPLVDVELSVLVRRRPEAAPPFLVVLDGVTDPHNVGAVMRSALSAGATGLVVARHRAAHLGPTAVKAAAGAAEWLPVAVVAGIPNALSELREAGVWTVGLDAGGEVAVWDLEVATEPLALVLGAEGDGLSRLTRQRCELVASVPMQGPLASLNVSAAAALGCFEVARRRLSAAPPSPAG
jgi:23S rRNA (guanosine2251-2'-O)-methyltransferase